MFLETSLNASVSIAENNGQSSDLAICPDVFLEALVGNLGVSSKTKAEKRNGTLWKFEKVEMENIDLFTEC